MRGLFTALVTVIVPLSADAGECPDLGVENDYLSRQFCEQLEGIITQTGQDRSTWPTGEEPPEDIGNAPWRGLGILEEAYSRDPKKTLELIERIKAAGGLDIK